MKLFYSSFLILLSFHTLSQTYLKGSVSQKNGSPIVGTTLFIEGSYDGTISNSEGNFEFLASSSGEKKLIVRSIGFESQTIPVSLTTDSLVLNIVLKEKLNELNTVTINAGAFEAGDKKKSVALNSIDLITVPGAQGNVVGALQYLPGTSTNGESGRLFVRGGNSRESQVYIDGTLVPAPYSRSAPNTAVRSRFNPFMFDGTVFSTGGFSAEYGQALSSVLILNTKGIQEQDQLDISLLSVSLGLAGTKKWKSGAITASIDHTNLAPYTFLVPQNIDWIKAPIANSASTNFRQKTKKGLFKFYAAYNDSHFKLNRNEPDNNTLNYTLQNKNLYLNSSWTRSLSKKWLLKTAAAFTKDNNSVLFNAGDFSEDLTGSHLKAVVSGPVSTRFQVKFGGEIISRNYGEHFNDTIQTSFEFTDHILAGFAEASIYLSKKWVSRIGTRYEYSNYLNRSNFSPRLSMAYKFNDFGQLALATGLFYQQAENSYLIYTDKLNFERAEQYMLSYQWDKNKRTIRTELYRKSYHSLVKFTNSPFYLPDHYTNDGHGYAQGFDLFFRDRKSIRNGDYWISYSFIDTKRNERHFPDEAVPSYVSKHNLSIVYKHWVRKWRSLIGASFNYGSPRYYNDPNKTNFNSEQTRAFQSLNLNWSFLYRENIIFYASASNVLGYRQEFGYEFSDTPNSKGIYESRLIEPPAPRFYIIGCFITLSKSGDKNQLDKIN